ncbi:MAG TPA: NADH-quinone oxidoreductase subunit L, partial [Mycobacterium sp.]|nr:NADH-quinone oxidoreductase subunit L [Mycobacterium sp.]
MTALVWLLWVLPAAGAAVLLLAGRRSDRWGHLLGCATIVAAFGIGVVLLAALVGRAPGERVVHDGGFAWVQAGGLRVSFGMLLDPLSTCFV